MTVQGSKQSERRPNREEKAAGSVDAVEGADRKSATITASPAPAILLIPYVIRSYTTTNPNQSKA